MATTRDYLGYLNDKIEIAPANSQEELLAAEAIEQIMDEHGLDVHLQEFDAPASGELPHRIMMLLLCLGVFLAGLQGTPASIVGIIVTAICLILFVLYFLGSDVLGSIGMGCIIFSYASLPILSPSSIAFLNSSSAFSLSTPYPETCLK